MKINIRSLMKKIMNAFKQSAFYNILLDPHSGEVISDKDLNSPDQLKSLAQASGVTFDEMTSIGDIFKAASSGVQKTYISLSSSTPSNPFGLGKIKFKPTRSNTSTSSIGRTLPTVERDRGEE